MTISSQQYAGLANDSYEDSYPVGVFPPGKGPPFEHEGVAYTVLEHVNNRSNGYQGTVYQRVDTGEIVVAHRGTEFRKLTSDPQEAINDLVRADGGMLLARTNLQAGDAIALTARSKAYAERYADDFGGRSPEVTLTGHSLGGTLAQISAHTLGLRGETFNAFGAVSLKAHGIEPGSGLDRMTNHVKATDFVSAASPHYGQVRTYATVQDIDKLNQHGYLEHAVLDRLAVDAPMVVAGRSIDDHLMHHFMGVDKQQRPDLSLLDDPAARSRVTDNARTIDDYRSDVAQVRFGVTHSIGLPFQGIQHGLKRLQENLEESLRQRFVPPPAGGMPQALPQQMPPGFPVPGYRPLGALDPSVEQRPPATPSLQADPAGFVDRMLAAAQSGDAITFRQLGQEAANSDAGRELRAQAVAGVDLQEQQAQRQAEQQQLMAQQQEAPARAMRMG